MIRGLIVCADDFGMTPGVNRGIVAAHRDGIVTSASLMVCQSAAEEGAAIGRSNPDLAIGLHLDLGEWVYSQGRWSEAYRVIDTADAAAVEREVAHQLNRFERLVGVPPTHLDSHQHVHCEEPVRSALTSAGDRLGVPVRHRTPGIAFCGDFHGQSSRGEANPQWITVEALVRLIEGLPAGITELCTHPGQAAGLASSYSHEREAELRALCDPQARNALERCGVELLSFADDRILPA